MAHDGSAGLNGFSSVTDASNDDLSVGGKLSLSTQDENKPLAAGGILSTTDILAPASDAQDFSFTAPQASGDLGAAGHVDALTIDLHLAGGVASLGDAAVSFAGSAPGGGLGAPGAAGTLQTLANYLETGFWSDRGQSSHFFNMTSTGSWANSGTLYYNVTGWSGAKATDYGNEFDSDGISAARQVMVREAFKLYEAVTGIHFVETQSASADFFFEDSDTAHAYEGEKTDSGSGGAVQYGVINVAPGWESGTSNIGGADGYTFQTFLHEIGHALGLGHQGLYNAGSGSPTYANSAIWANDSWQQSMMSYWSQGENTEFSNDSYAMLVTPMAVDWIALNDLYSWQGYGTFNAFTGNTIYGVGTNISAATSASFNALAANAATNAFTIVDGGGIDTVDFSNYNVNQTIDLTVNSASQTHAVFSSVGGLVDNMTIAVGVVIENATTGGGNDNIFGNEAANVLTGNAGNDYLSGYGGGDTEYGGTGADTLYAGNGGNSMYGGDQADYLSSGSGADFMSGGAGQDTLYGGGGADYMWAYDSLTVNNSDQVYGAAGNDTIFVGTGAETADGGADTNTLIVMDTRSYVLDLGTGATNHAGEVFSNFQVVFMSSGDDSVTGVSGTAETIYGGSGNDTINPGSVTGADQVYGGDGNDSILSGLGNETMDGGNGIDVIDHRVFNGDYQFNMATGATQFLGESYVNFEIAYMGNGNDSVTGNASDNVIYGGGGNDTIDGGAGADQLYGDGGDDTFQIHNGWTGGVGEVFNGGAGSDTFDASATVGVTTSVIDLVAGSFNYTPGGAAVISFVSIENVVGTSGNDSIIGNFVNNALYGGAGDDTIIGGAGVDQSYGGAGNDLFTIANGWTGGPGEVIDGGADSDTFDISATFGVSATIDLVAGTFNYQGGDGQIALVSIENVVGGDGNDSILGNNASNQLYGGAGDDTINDGAGIDSVYGGDGNDLILAGDTSFSGDSWFGGNDIDTLSFVGTTNWTTAGVSFNFVTGIAQYSSFTEHFSGFEIFQDNNGSDLIISDGLGHSFYGNDGDDTMVGAAGLQNFFGGNGTDTVDLTARSASTNLNIATGLTNFGGEQYSGFEVIKMGAGDDTVSGAPGNSTVYGGDGNDLLTGGASTDNLYGDGGNDTLDGSFNVDNLYGGAGNDLFTIAGTGMFDNVYGGADTDTLDLTSNASGQGFTVDLLAGTYDGISLGFGPFVIQGVENVVGSTLNDNIHGDNSNNTLSGGNGDDTLNGGGGVDDIYGGDGNDLLIYTSGEAYDNFYGGNGVDTVTVDWDIATKFDLSLGAYTYTSLFGTANLSLVGIENVTKTGLSDDILIGNGVANILDAGDGNDSIYGNGGADTLIGGAGDDTLNGGSGIDSLDGGAGNDWYYVDSNSDVVVETAGNGTADRVLATVNYALSATADIEQLSTTQASGVAAINLTGNNLAQTITGNEGVNVLSGLGGNDTLIGGGGNDSLNGGTGDDKMYGGAGDDWYYVDSASDGVFETAGNGTVDRVLSTVTYILAAAADIEILSTMQQSGTTSINLTGNALSQTISGNNGVNMLYGGDGADTINGWDGNDTLNGGTGDDSMIGGAGDDWYYVDSALDKVIETAGNGTADRVLSTVDYTLSATADIETLSTTLASGVTAINLTGNNLAQTIAGNEGVNVLSGLGGNDTLNGGGGNDTLNGGTGDDRLYGGTGDDWYYVDSASDVVIETAGNGTADRVLSTVNYVLAAAADIEILSTTLASGVTAINLTGNNLAQTITGNNGTNILSGLGGNDTLNGLDGTDTLNGGTGNDLLIGGTGADTFVFDTALGATNVDAISGYSVVDDVIQLSSAIFTGLGVGALAAGAYAANTTGLAALATDHIIYNTATGALYFDADGVGGAAGIKFATIAPNLAGFGAGEFFVI